MGRPTVVLDLAGKHELARDLVAGGVFVPACEVGMNEECELVMRGSGGGPDEVHVTALVVFKNAAGAGLQLLGCDAELKQRIAVLATAPAPEMPAREAVAAESAADEAAEESIAPAVATATDDDAGESEPQVAGADDADEGDDDVPKSVHERLRGLTLVQQLKMAREGDLSERILLERFYGKNVWEAILRNPRVTAPEVARIARMGALPRPMIELIVGNGGWLGIPEVRRALLSNPRLGTDQIQRVLRLMPKHELKLASTQTAYPFAVRNAAKTMLKD